MSTSQSPDTVDEKDELAWLEVSALELWKEIEAAADIHASPVRRADLWRRIAAVPSQAVRDFLERVLVACVAARESASDRRDVAPLAG